MFNAAKNHLDYQAKCKMEGNCVILKGTEFGLHNISELPKELSGHKVTSRTRNSITGFFGQLNPMSNFHKCTFTVNGVKFNSMEQFIQYTKAYYFENSDLSKQILTMKEAFDCKALSREIIYLPEKTCWAEVARELCYPGIKAKCEQNENL